MIPIAKLRQNLEFNKNLGDIIEVMKLAATLQFNQFRSNKEPFADFIVDIEQAMGYIAELDLDNKFFTAKNELPSAIVLISSDEGFLGELNSILINKLVAKRQPRDYLIVLGQQGANYLEEIGYSFSAFPAVTDKLDFAQVEAIRDYVLGLFNENKVGAIHVIYGKFINITAQQVESEDLLPAVAGNLPKPGKDLKYFFIEPNAHEAMEGCVKLWLACKFYQIFWSSKLAEFSARIMHLEGSSKELLRTNQRLKLEYFKYLHSLSDKTIREIVASRLKARN